MPVDLVGALVGWVVGQAGNAGIRLARRPPDERALRTALGVAIDRVVGQADPSCREALRLGLRECFSAPPRLELTAATSVSEGLRAAIAAQVAQLGQMVHGDTGQPFFHTVAVDRGWLSEQVSEAILAALRQVAATGGLAELVHGVDAAEVLARLNTLGAQDRESAGSAAAVATRTLPRDIGGFTGRHGELRKVRTTVTDRALTGGVVGIHAIDGMAGIGKTALAVHAAHEIARHFPDGQIFLRLHAHTPGQQPVDPADALATLLLTMGVAPRQIPADREARELLWRDRLAGKKVLLVLDDAAGHQQVDPLLPGTAGSLVLITSRRRLPGLDDAVAISLDILTPAEAAALFLRVAARRDVAPTDAAVTEVTRLCGYLPLAIQLVAGRLHHSKWTVADVAAELATTRDRPAVMAGGERSVAAAFDLSYRNLTGDQQRTFRLLGLVPGAEVDTYAAAALTDTAVPAARRCLDELYDRHLIEDIAEPARGRFRFHDLLGEYARTLAATGPPADRDTALHRLLDYYLHTATVAAGHFPRHTRPTAPAVLHPPSAVPDLATRDAALAWLRTERANLHAATDYAAHHGHHAHAHALPVAMHDFLRTHGPWDQALTLHQTAVDAARTTGDRLGEANTLTYLSVVQYLTGDCPAAAASQQQALALYRDLGDLLGQAAALTYLSLLQRVTGDYPAVASLGQALTLYRDLGDRIGEATALIYLGVVQYLTGDYPAAAASQRQALALYRDLGSRLGQAAALGHLGYVHYLTGDYPTAAAGLGQALALFRELGHRLGEAAVLTSLGVVQYQTGDYPTAAASQGQALTLYRDLGDRYGEAETLNNLGQLLGASADPADARVHHGQALDIARALGTPLEQARALEGIGHSHLHQGQHDHGTEYLRQALALYQRLGSPQAQRVETALAHPGRHLPRT